jgi:hypothetical protein
MEKRSGNGGFGFPLNIAGKISSSFCSFIRFPCLLEEFDEGVCQSACVFFLLERITDGWLRAAFDVPLTAGRVSQIGVGTTDRSPGGAGGSWKVFRPFLPSLVFAGHWKIGK